MFEDLKDFLNNQKKNAKNLDKLWNEKIKFLENTLIEYETYRSAESAGFAEETKTSYKDGLAKFKDRFEIKKIKGIPLCVPSGFEPDTFDGEADWYLTYDVQRDVFNKLLFPERLCISTDNRPKDQFKIADYLHYLLIYYTFLVHGMPLETTLRIDFAMAKVLCAATKEITAVKLKRGVDIDRTGKTTATRRAKKEEMAKLILETYDNLSLSTKKDMSARSIANIVIRQIEGKTDSIPSIDTVIRRLKEHDRI